VFKQERKHTVDILFVITLFLVFAVSVVMLTGTGATVYQNIVNSMTENYNSRTSFSYIVNKIHQNDKSGGVKLGQYEGLDSVILMEEIDNITYCTYLYYYDGHIKEMFTRYGQEFDPALGTDILEIADFSAKAVTDTRYRFEITTPEQHKETLYVHVNSD
jgi:hypothetical protein